MAPQQAATGKTHILNNCDLRTLLEPTVPGSKNFLATKVTITIGPACQDVDTLVQLLDAGATCARLDLSWGSLEFHQQSLNNLMEAQRQTHKLCAVMLDTTGREVTIKHNCQVDDNKGWADVPECGITIQPGQKVTFSNTPDPSDPFRFQLNYERFTSMCKKGDTIFMGRYLVTGAESSSLYLEVLDVIGEDVVCVANNECSLEGLSTVFHTERSDSSLNNQQNDLPILSDNDKCFLKEICRTYEIDFISLSFVRSKEDLQQAREFCDSLGMKHTKLLAKCETRASLFKFPEIVESCDGVIIARGHLGLDVLPEKMALTQKRMISMCNIYGKPVYITRVVDTMISTPRPTRAEATDIANAVLDGVDGILLGAETLRGKYPVATVRTVLDIASQAEESFDHDHHYEYLTTVKDVGPVVEGGDDEDDLTRLLPKRSSSAASFKSVEGYNGNGYGNGYSSAWNLTQMACMGKQNGIKQMSKMESIASSAVKAAFKVGARMIIVFTRGGRTASLMSKYRPPVPILTLVVPTLQSDGLKWHLEGKYTARQCLIQHSLLPVLAAPSPSGETLLEEAVEMCVRRGLLNPGDHIVVVQQVAEESLTLKIVSVDQYGGGIQPVRPQSLQNLITASLPEGVDGTPHDTFSVLRGAQELTMPDGDYTDKLAQGGTRSETFTRVVSTM